MTIEKLTTAEWHNSQRGWFAGYLFKKMAEDERIIVVTADLGYGMWDKIRESYPDRWLNTGAAEQAAVGIACGMALDGKIPVVYSITPFLLARPYEWLRNYVNAEQIQVKLVGSGRDNDYEHDGLTHCASDAKALLNTLPNIVTMFPDRVEEVPNCVDLMLNNGKPTFLSLKR